MASNIRRGVRYAAMMFAVMVSAVFLSASPASAHTLDEAVRSADGCKWYNGSYTLQHSNGIILRNGTTRLGTAYLLWSPTYQQNCAIALKTHSSVHGVSTWTEIHLYVYPSTGYFRDGGYYGHFAAAYGSTRGSCVSYQGEIRTTSGQSAISSRVDPSWCD